METENRRHLLSHKGLKIEFLTKIPVFLAELASTPALNGKFFCCKKLSNIGWDTQNPVPTLPP